MQIQSITPKATLHYTTIHYTTIHYDTLQYTTTRYNRNNTSQYATIHYNSLQYTTVHDNSISVQHNAAQLQYNAVQRNTIHNITQQKKTYTHTHYSFANTGIHIYIYIDALMRFLPLTNMDPSEGPFHSNWAKHRRAVGFMFGGQVRVFLHALLLALCTEVLRRILVLDGLCNRGTHTHQSIAAKSDLRLG